MRGNSPHSTRGLPIMLDLIDVNDPTGRFRAALACRTRSLSATPCRAHLGMPVARRYSGGQDIHAACGMLAATRDGDRVRKC